MREAIKGRCPALVNGSFYRPNIKVFNDNAIKVDVEIPDYFRGEA